MNLAIDIGNSRTKIGLFDGKHFVSEKTFNNSSLSNFQFSIFNFQFSISKTILSSVIHHPKSFKNYLRKKFSLLILSHKTPLPIKIKYKTPHTLGKDRIAAVVGATSLFPEKNLLVIDAGTCITYDFVNKNGEYLGGSISPGIEMRFKALHTFTGKLPLIEKRLTPNPSPKERGKLIGSSTKESIMAGVEIAIVREMDGMIDLYKKKFKEIKIVITGGDSPFFETRLKNEIFAVPNLVLQGLNTILEYNS